MVESYTGIITEHGFPIFASLIAGYFIFLAIKHILQGVTDGIQGLKSKIEALEYRITTMNNDMKKIDISVSRVLGVSADLETVARSEESDTRKD